MLQGLIIKLLKFNLISLPLVKECIWLPNYRNTDQCTRQTLWGEGE